MPRTLYHFPQSPFSRRTRLLLAHKKLTADLRDGRSDAKSLAEGKALTPLGTFPVLQEPDGRVFTDSFAIALYLEHAYAGPSYFPTDKDDAFLVGSVVALVDRALNLVVDLGTRYYALRNDAAWEGVKSEHVGRVQGALTELAHLTASLGRATIAKSGYGIGDIWLLAAVLWFEGIPGRAATTPVVAQIQSLGVSLPPELSRWADPHRDMATAIFGS